VFVRKLAISGILAVGIGTMWAEIKAPKPGFNLFSQQQDIQLGNEAKAQVEAQQPVIHDNRINGYLTQLGQKLASSPHSGNWPFSFQGVYDKSINAFALPGGPMFINTATILAADNEAQLAGVMAHEMSHVVLRHGTHQMSKSEFIQLPAMLAGNMMGNGILGALGRMGVGLTANSVLLKYSRDAEAQADYNGALIMADVGYNPLEMARFFEKLEAQGGGGEGKLANFMSDHPTPGNRVKSVEREIQELPQTNYRDDITGQLNSVKAAVQQLPPPPKARQQPPRQ
jgi:beta-barrel assembly-enhancing protease